METTLANILLSKPSNPQPPTLITGQEKGGSSDSFFKLLKSTIDGGKGTSDAKGTTGKSQKQGTGTSSSDALSMSLDIIDALAFLPVLLTTQAQGNGNADSGQAFGSYSNGAIEDILGAIADALKTGNVKDVVKVLEGNKDLRGLLSGQRAGKTESPLETWVAGASGKASDGDNHIDGKAATDACTKSPTSTDVATVLATLKAATGAKDVTDADLATVLAALKDTTGAKNLTEADLATVLAALRTDTGTKDTNDTTVATVLATLKATTGAKDVTDADLRTVLAALKETAGAKNLTEADLATVLAALRTDTGTKDTNDTTVATVLATLKATTGAKDVTDADLRTVLAALKETAGAKNLTEADLRTVLAALKDTTGAKDATEADLATVLAALRTDTGTKDTNDTTVATVLAALRTDAGTTDDTTHTNVATVLAALKETAGAKDVTDADLATVLAALRTDTGTKNTNDTTVATVLAALRTDTGERPSPPPSHGIEGAAKEKKVTPSSDESMHASETTPATDDVVRNTMLLSAVLPNLLSVKPQTATVDQGFGKTGSKTTSTENLVSAVAVLEAAGSRATGKGLAQNSGTGNSPTGSEQNGSAGQQSASKDYVLLNATDGATGKAATIVGDNVEILKATSNSPSDKAPNAGNVSFAATREGNLQSAMADQTTTGNPAAASLGQTAHAKAAGFVTAPQKTGADQWIPSSNESGAGAVPSADPLAPIASAGQKGLDTHEDRKEDRLPGTDTPMDNSTKKVNPELYAGTDSMRTAATEAKQGTGSVHTNSNAAAMVHKIEEMVENYANRGQSQDMVLRLKIDDKDSLLVSFKDQGNNRVAVEVKRAEATAS